MKKLLKLTKPQRRMLAELAPGEDDPAYEKWEQLLEQDRRRKRWSERAANLLVAADEHPSCAAAAKRVGISRNTLALWLRRFRESGVTGITRDALRSGRPRKISDAQIQQIKSALRVNRRLKVRRESIRALARRLRVLPMTVWRLNKAMGTKR